MCPRGSFCAALSLSALLSLTTGCESDHEDHLTRSRPPVPPILATYQIVPNATPALAPSPRTRGEGRGEGSSHFFTSSRLTSSPIPFLPTSHHIAIPVSLNDGPPRAFILDTGAPLTTVLVSPALLNLPTVRNSLSPTPNVDLQGLAGPPTAAYRRTARSISVGPARQTSFPYLLLPTTASSPALGDTPFGPVVGILGNDFLSHYRVTLDYQRQTLTLDPR